MKRSLVALGLLVLTSTAAPAQQASDTVAPEGATGLAAAKITTAREHMVAAAIRWRPRPAKRFWPMAAVPSMR